MNIKDFPELTSPQLNDWLLIQQNATIPAYHKIKLQTLLEFLGGTIFINPPVNNSINWVNLSDSQWLNLSDSQWLNLGLSTSNNNLFVWSNLTDSQWLLLSDSQWSNL